MLWCAVRAHLCTGRLEFLEMEVSGDVLHKETPGYCDQRRGKYERNGRVEETLHKQFLINWTKSRQQPNVDWLVIDCC